jgi:ribosomal protein S18 acetylase RimI-like enzyme
LQTYLLRLENGIVGSEAFAAFFDEQFLDQRMKFFGSRERYCLNWLGISPRFQRRELGKRLVSEGLEIAKAKGVMACLEASPYGIGLYSKLGFKECDTFSFTWQGTNVSLPAVRLDLPGAPSLTLAQMKWEP